MPFLSSLGTHGSGMALQGCPELGPGAGSSQPMLISHWKQVGRRRHDLGQGYFFFFSPKKAKN